MYGGVWFRTKEEGKRKKRGKDFILTVDYCCPYSRDCVFSEIAVLRRSKFIWV
jgi:hypothetical protein